MARKRKWAYAVSAIAIAFMMTPNLAWAQDPAPVEEE